MLNTRGHGARRCQIYAALVSVQPVVALVQGEENVNGSAPCVSATQREVAPRRYLLPRPEEGEASTIILALGKVWHRETLR